MKKIITIVTILIVTIALSSCGIQFGNYDHYQKVHGNKNTCNTNWIRSGVDNINVINK